MLRPFFTRFATRVVAAGLVCGSATPAHAGEIGYTYSKVDAAMGYRVPTGISPLPGALSFSLPMHTVTFTDTEGWFAGLLATRGAMEEARKAAEDRVKEGEWYTFGYKVIPFVEGVDSYLSLGFGTGLGSTLVTGGNSSVSTGATSLLLLDGGIAAPGLYIFNWLELSWLLEFRYRSYNAQGLTFTSTDRGRTYGESSLQVPVDLVATIYPLPFVRLQSSIGYDPIAGIVALIPDLGGRQPFYYGAKAEVSLLGHLRGSVGYQRSIVNIDISRPLDDTRLETGVAINW
jgi:hypothetical protein